MKGKNFILTIAIDNYSDSKFNNLNNAKLDTDNIQNILLDNYGFDLIEDSISDECATRERIINTLASLSNSLLPNDNIIIYFAGHGIINKKSRLGYWVPYDAKYSSIATCINNSTVIDSIKAIDCKHLLLISDSCFSGSFITSHRSVEFPMSFKKLNEKSSRWILTSGRVESVSDGEPLKGSPFAISFYEYLNNNREPFFSLLDIANYITKETSSRTNQQPVCSPLSFYNHEGGQLVFKYDPNKGKSRIGWEAKFEEFCNSKETIKEWPHISQYNPKTKSLGRWCSDQRNFKRTKKLSVEREKRLIDAGFVFNPYIKKFYSGFGKFMAFMHETGYNYVPSHLRKQYNVELAWLRLQRNSFRKNPENYPKYRYDLLVKNGIALHTNSNDDIWDEFCIELIKFYSKNEKFITIPSQVSKDEKISWLGNKLNDYMYYWKKDKLTDEKVAILSMYVDKDYQKNTHKRNFYKKVMEFKEFQNGNKNRIPKQRGNNRALGVWLAQIKCALNEGT
ncbi:caspase family protein, partial [Winogradskyella sp. 4-2091]|uniref:caspase family protein n=1 Tax=Winogradskyella sp. 4-2091 TaxID=3381659 RepID=UPI0038924A00